ncbi:MAG TPA: methyltransferase domain-containing protein [Geminicoccaceae bacterium]
MSEDFERAFPANAAQAAYWNVDIADKWVDNQVALDRRFQAITDALIGRAGPRLGERVLEVGCGTGATTLALAEAVGPAGHVLGVDISGPMLRLAGRRVRDEGHDHVTLLQADAQTHTFERSASDLVASRFGVMFFSDPVAAFRNLRWALRQNGRLAFACWTDLEANPWFAHPLEIASRHLGPPEPRHPHAPGPFAFADGAHVHSILEGAGFAEILVDREEIPIDIEGPAEDEAAFASHMGPAARLIRERAADPDAVAQAIQTEVADAFRPFATAGGVRFPAVVFLVSARAP